MAWAAPYIARLQAGETVQFRPRGHSMRGKIESGQLVTVAPVEHSTLAVGDIVLCRVHGHHYLHLIRAITGANKCFLIGNNHGKVNGWAYRSTIYGKCIAVEA